MAYYSKLQKYNFIKNYKDSNQTAKANGLEPEEYIRNLFEQAPYCETKEDWKKLLPWNIELKPFDDSGEWV